MVDKKERSLAKITQDRTGLNFDKTQKMKFLDVHQPQFALDIKNKSVKLANSQCEINRCWIDWDDLFAGTFGKASHGKFTGVFRTYMGISNTLGSICQKCPKIMQDTHNDMRNHEKNN